jgi:hypothetical protein
LSTLARFIDGMLGLLERDDGGFYLSTANEHLLCSTFGTVQGDDARVYIVEKLLVTSYTLASNNNTRAAQSFLGIARVVLDALAPSATRTRLLNKLDDDALRFAKFQGATATNLPVGEGIRPTGSLKGRHAALTLRATSKAKAR